MQGLLDSILTAVKVKERSGEAMDGQLKSLIHDGFDKMRHVVAPFIHGQRCVTVARCSACSSSLALAGVARCRAWLVQSVA